MRANGASQEAVAFTASQDGLLYISGWRPSEPGVVEVGAVDLARVICTFGTIFNCGYSYLLVNGSPSIIPVSIDTRPPGFVDGPVSADIHELWASIRADPTYQAIASSGDTRFVDNVWGG
jgi:hypothetical protein